MSSEPPFDTRPPGGRDEPCPKRDDGLHWFDTDDRCIYCDAIDPLRDRGLRMNPPFDSDSIVSTVTDALSGFGGYVRCETCGRRGELGDVPTYIASGWPKCCGYTMRWWTARQVEAGEDA